MEKWYKLTDKTKKVENVFLKEFVYNIDFMNKKKGESGGFVDDDSCLRQPFSATNATIYGDTSIARGTVIENSVLVDVVIEVNLKIVDSNLSGVAFKRGDFETSYDCGKEIQHEIRATILEGNSWKKLVFVFEEKTTSKLFLLESGISLSEYYASSETEDIYIGKTCSLIIKRCNIVLKRHQMKLEKFCALFAYGTKMVNPNIKLSGKNLLKTRSSRIVNSYIAGNQGMIIGHCVDIEDSEIRGGISVDCESKGIVIKKTLVSNQATIKILEKAEEQTINNVEMTESAKIIYEKNAKKSIIENSLLSGYSVVKIEKRNIHINNSKIEEFAIVEDTNLSNTHVLGSAGLFNTSAQNCKFRGNTKIGDSVPASVFSKTSFSGIEAKDMLDFFVVPVIKEKYYYIFTRTDVYRLSEFLLPALKFMKIDINEEEAALEKITRSEFPNSILSNENIDYQQIIEDSQNNILKNILNDKNPDYKKMSIVSRKLVEAIVLKLFVTSIFKEECSYDEEEKYDNVIEQLENKTFFDIKNKKYKKLKEQILVFPEMLLRKKDNKDFDYSKIIVF